MNLRSGETAGFILKVSLQISDVVIVDNILLFVFNLSCR